jgi:ABC-type nitrate/sulfonate/bicarbonate transport system substrate-binding protein
MKRAISMASAALLCAVTTASCGNQDNLSLTVNAGNRSLSKLPFIIAYDQGLYAKHGLDIELIIPGPEFEGGKEIPAEVGFWTGLKRRVGLEAQEIDVEIRGGTPMAMAAVRNPGAPHDIDIGSTDCAVRSHIIGRKGFSVASYEELRGKRIGVSGPTNTLGFQARMLAQRLGSSLNETFTVVDVEADGFEELDAGTADVIFVNEIAYAKAKKEGYPVLFDTGDWNEDVAGNSIAVSPEWLRDPQNREAAKRFLMATAEAISLFHTDHDLAKRVLREWNGVQDPQIAQDIVDRGRWLPKKPYACVAGFEKTMALYQDLGTDKFKASDFYDNSLMQELDDSGFLDGLYADAQASAQ